MIKPEELVGKKWARWYRLSPAQRWQESEQLWQVYLALGGSLDPEPDSFFQPDDVPRESAKQRKILKIIKRLP